MQHDQDRNLPPMGYDTQVTLTVNHRRVIVDDPTMSLLELLRERLGHRDVKDGCAPQGQCGCCTVLVDGQPRVACVTPVRRVAGRSITTAAGLADGAELAEAFVAAGASQCGFCTPGILCRISGQRARASGPLTPAAVSEALKAHLCRCTGWQTIAEAVTALDGPPELRHRPGAAVRAALEGGTPQRVDPAVCLGAAGFADDEAPPGALVAVRNAAGEWVLGESLPEARAAAGKVQGRRTTLGHEPPLALPPGEWARTLRTSWVEPAYLELDATWCAPGGQPASLLGNGGAFGAKTQSTLGQVARELADRHGRPVRVLLSREDVVRLGPKRPPIAAGVGTDGRGVVRVARTRDIARRIQAVAPGLAVEECDLAGPPTSAALRGAGWVEAHCLLASVTGATALTAPSGAYADALVDDGGIQVTVRCGEPLDDVVLRSYCIGAAHMAYSWVTSEALAVDAAGTVEDLTVRSFGVLRAVDTPPISVTIDASDAPPVNGSDAVFAAVAAATWRAVGWAPEWPTGT